MRQPRSKAFKLAFLLVLARSGFVLRAAEQMVSMTVDCQAFRSEESSAASCQRVGPAPKTATSFERERLTAGITC